MRDEDGTESNLQRPSSYPYTVLGDGRALAVDHGPQQIGRPKMEFVGGHSDEYGIFLKKLTETELTQIISLKGALLDIRKELRQI